MMKLKRIALTFSLCILSFVSLSCLSAELEPVKQISFISSFGVTLGQPIAELPVTKKTNEYIYIQPKDPLTTFFDTYRVIQTPDERVYKFIATGDLSNKNFTCIEVAAALNRSFMLKYGNGQGNGIMRPLDNKNGQYVYMNDFVIASIQCIAGQISYSYAYRQDLNDFYVPINKLKDVKINL